MPFQAIHHDVESDDKSLFFVPGSWVARDNISHFIEFCNDLHINECLRFETDDLVLRKNEKSVILCLLEVARHGFHFGSCKSCIPAYTEGKTPQLNTLTLLEDYRQIKLMTSSRFHRNESSGPGQDGV